MHARRMLTIASALSLGLSASCFAVEPPEQRQIQNMTQPGQPLPEGARPSAGSEAQSTQPSPFLRASKLVGMNVKNGQGENLGDVKDIILDTERGQIVYAVVSFGGFLGMGDKLFAVPWNALRHPEGANRDYYVLNVDKETLKTAPGFNENTWPDMANRSWQEDVYRYYNNLVPYQPEVRPR
jgi:sporulation protein YlmC with PRC-barrel domain